MPSLSPTRSLYWNTFPKTADCLCLPSWSKEKAVLEFLCKIVPMRSYWTIGHLSSGLPSESALQWLKIISVARFCERLWVIFFTIHFREPPISPSIWNMKLKNAKDRCALISSFTVHSLVPIGDFFLQYDWQTSVLPGFVKSQKVLLLQK